MDAVRQDDIRFRRDAGHDTPHQANRTIPLASICNRRATAPKKYRSYFQGVGLRRAVGAGPAPAAPAGGRQELPGRRAGPAAGARQVRIAPPQSAPIVRGRSLIPESAGARQLPRPECSTRLQTEGRPQDTRVVVAMSGGVDSSVTAALLKAEGYDVVGVTLQLYDHGAATHRKGACCAGQDIHDARAVADRIGIPHYVLDYESRFKEAVIDRFAESYVAGETPVPCVDCNMAIKFHDLLEHRARARRQGAGDRPLRRLARAAGRRPRALPRARGRARPELFPVRHHARAARTVCAFRSATRPRRRRASWRAASGSRSPTSTTARTSASCRPGATPT